MQWSGLRQWSGLAHWSGRTDAVERTGKDFRASAGPFVVAFFCLFGLRLYVPVKQIFSHVGTEPPLPGYYQYFLGGKCILRRAFRKSHFQSS